MAFMTEGLRDIMRDIAEFHFLDAPFELKPEIVPGEPGLLKHGFKGPFWSWSNRAKKTPEVRKLLE
jgi:hypothetical protein